MIKTKLLYNHNVRIFKDIQEHSRGYHTKINQIDLDLIQNFKCI